MPRVEVCVEVSISAGSPQTSISFVGAPEDRSVIRALRFLSRKGLKRSEAGLLYADLTEEELEELKRIIEENNQ